MSALSLTDAEVSAAFNFLIGGACLAIYLVSVGYPVVPKLIDTLLAIVAGILVFIMFAVIYRLYLKSRFSKVQRIVIFRSPLLVGVLSALTVFTFLTPVRAVARGELQPVQGTYRGTTRERRGSRLIVETDTGERLKLSYMYSLGKHFRECKSGERVNGLIDGAEIAEMVIGERNIISYAEYADWIESIRWRIGGFIASVLLAYVVFAKPSPENEVDQ